MVSSIGLLWNRFCVFLPWCVGCSGWLHSGLVYLIWAVVFGSDGVSLTLAWCGKTYHGGSTVPDNKNNNFYKRCILV